MLCSTLTLCFFCFTAPRAYTSFKTSFVQTTTEEEQRHIPTNIECSSSSKTFLKPSRAKYFRIFSNIIYISIEKYCAIKCNCVIWNESLNRTQSKQKTAQPRYPLLYGTTRPHFYIFHLIYPENTNQNLRLIVLPQVVIPYIWRIQFFI